MKEISVIGATSSLGINLVSLLARNGYKVHASYRSEDRLPHTWLHSSSIDCHKVDLAEQDDFQAVCRESVVWLAHLQQGRFNDRESEANLTPFRRFLDGARNCGTKKVVFVSSGGSVYGEAQFLPITENHPRNPMSSYGKAKLAMEDELSAFSRKVDMQTAIIRPGNIYGFDESIRQSKGIVSAFLNSIDKKMLFTLIHNGQTIRDFVHVDDVSNAILAGIRSSKKDVIWNVATGRGTSSAEILEMILAMSGFEAPKIEHVANFSSDLTKNILSIEQIRAESKWSPHCDLEDGISQTIEDWSRLKLNQSRQL